MKTNTQYETSITHQNNIASGLTVVWDRSTGVDDNAWSVVCYSDGSVWWFDNGSSEKLTVLGEMLDGPSKCKILQNGIGAIIALHDDVEEIFSDGEAWIASIAERCKTVTEAITSPAVLAAHNYHGEPTEFLLNQVITHVTDEGAMVKGRVTGANDGLLRIVFADGEEGWEAPASCY